MQKRLKIPHKVSRRLAEIVRSISDVEMLDVVVELDHHLIDNLKKTEVNQTRNELIASRKESFARTSMQVEDAISKVGGEVTMKAWINNTIRARLPVRSLQRISELDEVDVLDSPQDLQLD